MARRERKVVTALFVDLAEFTSRSETMDPEDVAAFLDPYYARLKGELERHGGTVEKFIGDAVVAIFGAPVAHEDDAERAVRAAIAIRDWAEEEKIELRVGINTGDALVRLDATPAEGEGIAAGDVVNTASRLQSNAPLGQILVGEQTYRATQNAIMYEQAEPIQAKGKADPVPVWIALSARARVQVERVHGATLVGRRRELDIIEGTFERARQERSCQLVTLVGVPGIGKSRLVLELYGRVEQEQELISWRNGRCLPYGEGITFWALGEMVKAQAGILEDDDDVETERKLRESVDDPWIESHLRPLVGLPGRPEGGGDRREEAFTAWRRFFEGLAEERPLVLAFDDIHWADDNLLDFIDHLVDWAAGVPILVVSTARSELLTRRPGWGGGKPNAITISLSPLSDEDTTTLLRELLESTSLQGDAQLDLLARAGGNPLYAEEYVRILRERGRVEQLPETVQGMIAARLDLLDVTEKSLIQDAAVVGKTFWLGALLSLTGEERRSVEDRLHALERKEFVRRERSSSVAGDTEYSFRHVLFRDVAYGQIPRADRAKRHVASAEWIEGLGRPEDHAEMLAHHYLEALEPGAASGLDTASYSDRARSALADAGHRAYALSAFDAAARYYRAALEQSRDDDPRRAVLLLQLGSALWLLGEPAVEVLESARDLMQAKGDSEGLGYAETLLAENFLKNGEHEAAFSHLERAREILEPLPPSRVKAHTIVTASRFLMVDGQDHEAIEMGRRAIEMADQFELDEIKAAALDNIGSAKGALGDPSGVDDLEEAIRIAAAANATWELVRAKNNLGARIWERGQVLEASALREEAREDAIRFGHGAWVRWLDGSGVTHRYVTGDWDGALAAADRFIRDIEAGSPSAIAAPVYGTRALIRLGRAERNLAIADAEQALALGRTAAISTIFLPAMAIRIHLAHELGDRETAETFTSELLSLSPDGFHGGFEMSVIHNAAWAITYLGRGPDLAERIKLKDSPWAQAILAILAGQPERAAELFGEMGDLTDQALARLRAGEAFTTSGREDEAKEHLTSALGFYRSVDASRYIQQCEALLGGARD